MTFQPKMIRELLNWSYANLAAYQVALKQKPPQYVKVCWMTRTRVFKGLQAGDMKHGSLYANEREKLLSRDKCAYCGKQSNPLTLDHLFAKSKNGPDTGDNLVYCCRSCNASKGTKDYFEWIRATGRKLNTNVAERYLKNAYDYCTVNGLLDVEIEKAPKELPFALNAIPLRYSIFIAPSTDS